MVLLFGIQIELSKTGWANKSVTETMIYLEWSTHFQMCQQQSRRERLRQPRRFSWWWCVSIENWQQTGVAFQLAALLHVSYVQQFSEQVVQSMGTGPSRNYRCEELRLVPAWFMFSWADCFWFDYHTIRSFRIWTNPIILLGSSGCYSNLWPMTHTNGMIVDVFHEECLSCQQNKGSGNFGIEPMLWSQILKPPIYCWLLNYKLVSIEEKPLTNRLAETCSR